MAIGQWLAASSAARKAGPSARPPVSLIKEISVMMEESLHGEFRRWSLGHRLFAKWMPRRAGTRHLASLAAIDRIATAVRLWRARACSRQQMRELNDHLLKDIGLRREDIGFVALKPFGPSN
jgi:uncharacterized protein YjiS (DUF1127 family)